MKSFALLFAGLTLPLSLYASDNTRWTIRETEPNGQIRVRVIEGVTSNKTQDSTITQDVVFDQTMTPLEAANFNQDRAAFAPFAQPRSGKPLWVPVKNSWTPADEDAYSAWFAANANTTFLDGTDVIVDCADTGLLFRWVYARNNQMPIANTMSGSGNLVGHFSSNANWDALPTNADWKKDERFKAALRYVFGNTYTGTVENDLAPVAITTNYVRPGAMFMIIRPNSGHTQSIVALDPHDGIKTLWGNEPASQDIAETPLLVEVNGKNKQTLGVWRNVRPTQAGSWELTPAAQVPGYSLEQYQRVFQDSSDYTLWIDDQVGIHLSNFDTLSMLSQSFGTGLGMRLSVTAQSFFTCYQAPNQCAPGSPNYNDYSTNSRDARLLDLQKQISALVQKLGPDDPDVKEWESQFTMNHPIIIGSDTTDLNLMLDASIIPKWNPDPRVSFAVRWGLADTSATDSNFAFFMHSTMMYLLTFDREMAFWSDSPKDTTQIDGQIRQLFAIAQKDRAAKSFLPASLGSTLKAYEYYTVYIQNAPTVPGCDQDQCTMNAVIWGEDGKSDVVDKWTSKASDMSPARWGL